MYTKYMYRDNMEVKLISLKCINDGDVVSE